MKNLLMLILVAVFVCETCYGEERASQKWLRQSLISRGKLLPEDNGFFGEMNDGFCQSFFIVLKPFNEEYFTDYLDCNQQWKRPMELPFLSATGRLIGEWAILEIILLIPVTIILTKRIKQSRKKWNIRKEHLKIEALDELRSGELNQAAWADALMRAKGNEEKARGEYIRCRIK